MSASGLLEQRLLLSVNRSSSLCPLISMPMVSLLSAVTKARSADSLHIGAPPLGNKESHAAALPQPGALSSQSTPIDVDQHKQSNTSVGDVKSKESTSAAEVPTNVSEQAGGSTAATDLNETEPGTRQHRVFHAYGNNFEKAPEGMISAPGRDKGSYSPGNLTSPTQQSVEPGPHQTQHAQLHGNVDSNLLPTASNQGPGHAGSSYPGTQYDLDQAQSHPLQSITARQGPNDNSMGSLSAPSVQHQMRAPSRPVKAKNKNVKKTRKTAAPVNDLNSEINDYMQIMMYKIRQQSQTSINRVALERDDAQQQLHLVLEAKKALEDQLSTLCQDNNDLLLTCDQQKTKLTSYETRAGKLKRFVEGLGRDMDGLKREANALRRKTDELIQASQVQKEVREELLRQKHACETQISNLKEQASAAKDATAQLQAAQAQIDHLEGCLSEKVGMLSEERDRRTQLEGLLTEAQTKSGKILKELRSDNDTVLCNIAALHEMMENSDANDKLLDTLSQVLEMMQAMSSQTKVSGEDAAAAKELVASLNDRSVSSKAMHHAPC